MSNYREHYRRERKKRGGKKHDFLNDLISGGPYKCQDHPAGGRKGPCYPESCRSILVIRALRSALCLFSLLAG